MQPNLQSSGGAAHSQEAVMGVMSSQAVINRVNSREQLQYQQQAHTDSRKTSGANTPSKDGADTPPYRDHLQQNSYVLNLTSKRLLQLGSKWASSNGCADQDDSGRDQQ